MDPRHRNKAIIGAAVSYAFGFGCLLLLGLRFEPKFLKISSNTLMIVFFVGASIHYATYWWSGSHLAKAKGYSNSMLLFGLLMPGTPIFVLTVLFALPDKHPQRSRHSQPEKHHRSRVSAIERTVRHRKKALIGIAIGLFGIIFAIAEVLFPAGFFRDGGNELALAIFVFAAGYISLIFGCGSWAKAKAWNEAIVFIGLMPLAILFIPWVRLIYVAVPDLLPVSMVMMPIILLVVLFVLPDKSGGVRRNPWDR